ncbi:MAG: hypothetical protein DI571_02315 [Arsenicicoccus sp.]|nr:MAG: hypothetical protein DI571_02315 [Arsenicicoccus sp.]
MTKAPHLFRGGTDEAVAQDLGGRARRLALERNTTATKGAGAPRLALSGGGMTLMTLMTLLDPLPLTTPLPLPSPFVCSMLEQTKWGDFSVMSVMPVTLCR